MAKKRTKSLRCPTCRKIVLPKDEHFPFCSQRCRTIDLGKWISGGYVISTPVNDPESGGEAEYHEPAQHRVAGVGGVRKQPETSGAASEREHDGSGKFN